MSNFSAGYYDLSITDNIDRSPLVTDEITVKTVVEYFFTTDLSLDSNLDIADYGYTYILGFKNKPHVYDCEKTAKTVHRVMIGKSAADNMPNALPSEKNYGFKSSAKFPIFSREIESYKVFSVPYRDSSKVKGNELLYSPCKTFKPVITLKPTYERKARGKYSAHEMTDKALSQHIGFKGRQTTKSSIKAGGRSKEFTNLSNKYAYASRLYIEKDCENPLYRARYQFLISKSGLVALKLNNEPERAIGQIIERDNNYFLSPTKDIKAGDRKALEIQKQATAYLQSIKAGEVLSECKIQKTLSDKERKYQDKKRRRKQKSRLKSLERRYVAK